MVHNYLPGQKVRHKSSGKVYDFGYASSSGVVVYEEGERNMQDSIAVDITDIEPASPPSPVTASPLKEKELIKVKTLDRKHAQQITVIIHDGQPGSFFNKVALATRPEELKHPEKPRAEVLGWVPTEVLNGLKLRAVSSPIHILRYWLVQYEGTLYWFPAPRESSEAGKAYQDLPQLFV